MRIIPPRPLEYFPNIKARSENQRPLCHPPPLFTIKVCNCNPRPPLPTEPARCTVGNLHSRPWLGAPKINRLVLTLLQQHLEGQGREPHCPIVPAGETPVPTGLRGQRSSLTKAAGEEGGSSVVQNGKPGSLPGAGRQVGILGRNWACLTSTDSS